MDIEHILRTLNEQSVEYIVIGGKSLLPTTPSPLACDVGVLINDTPANRTELNFALQELGCQWGPTADTWKPVSDDPVWLERQPVYCLTCPHGSLDIFRAIKGLEDGYDACKSRASIRSMQDGEMYYSLSDEDVKKVSGS